MYYISAHTKKKTIKCDLQFHVFVPSQRRIRRHVETVTAIREQHCLFFY